MNIVFFGSDDFAAYNLEKLGSSGHVLKGCVTPPDRPKGRHLHLTPSPVKETALRHQIPVLQPEDLNSDGFLNQLRDFQADLFVVISYGKKLPPRVLSMPRVFCINVHASLLPCYRGAAPINWAIINGDKKSGLTIFKVSEKMDAGEIISRTEIDIDQRDDAMTLREKLKNLSADFLVETITFIDQEKYSLTPQDPSMVTIAPKLRKELGEIDWTAGAFKIHNQIRGLLPWPGAYSFWKSKFLKILSSEVLTPSPHQGKAGCVVAVSKEGIDVACGEGLLRIKKVHLDSAKPMDAYSFLVGHKVEVDDQFAKK